MLNVKGIVEAILFSSTKPLSKDAIASKLRIIKKEEIDKAIEALIEEYKNPERGVEVVEVYKGYIMRTKVEYGEYVKCFRRKKDNLFSQSTLEVLAIVAYRQPITKREIDDLRGVNSGRAIKELLERDFIKIDGKRDGETLFTTTKRFLLTFGLKSLSDLPSIRELENL